MIQRNQKLHPTQEEFGQDLKAASESLRRIFCIINPTVRRRRIICNSMGPLGNAEEANGSSSSSIIGNGSKMKGWFELKKFIAQKNCQGKDLSSQLIQQSKFHAIHDGSVLGGKESFQQRHNVSLAPIFCNFNGSEVLTPMFRFIALDVPKTSCFPFLDAHHSGVQPSSSSSDIDTRILQQHLNN